MQIESLKVFADLAETESFTKAAQMNRITQSAVSQQVRSLERAYRTQLIERSRKHFRLTREGQIAYEYAKQIVFAYGELDSKIHELKDVVSGSIRVATIFNIGLHDLPPYLKGFLKSFPDVKVQIEYRRDDEVYEDVIGNSVDIGLVTFPEIDDRIDIVPLRKDVLVVACAPEHTLAKNKSVKAAALQGQNIVSFEPSSPIRRAIDRRLAEKKITLHSVMEFDNVETVKRAVEINAGIAIVPHNTIRQEIEKKTLAEVRVEDIDLTRQLAAIYRKKKVLSPAMKQFLKILKE